MDMRSWEDRIEEVSAGYAEYYGVERTPNWALLKLTEELGECTQAHLAASGQARARGRSPEELEATRADEVADVVAMALVVARTMHVDVEAALARKWLPWADFHRERRAGGDPLPPAALG